MTIREDEIASLKSELIKWQQLARDREIQLQKLNHHEEEVPKQKTTAAKQKLDHHEKDVPKQKTTAPKEEFDHHEKEVPKQKTTASKVTHFTF